MSSGKNTMERASVPPSHPTDPEQEARRKAAEEGRADIRAGRYVTLEEIQRWVETLGTPDERPVPQSKKR